MQKLSVASISEFVYTVVKNFKLGNAKKSRYRNFTVGRNRIKTHYSNWVKSPGLSLNNDLRILASDIFTLEQFLKLLAQSNGYCSRNRQIGNKLSASKTPLFSYPPLNITQLANRNANITQLRKRVSFDVILSVYIKLAHPLP